MTSDRGDAADDACWRRPSAASEAASPPGPQASAGAAARERESGQPVERDPAPPSDQAGSSGPAEPDGARAADHDGPSPWQRPDDPVDPPTPPSAPPAPSAYAGPPRSQPPPRGWRPPTVVQPPSPRQLPPQDLSALDAHERNARTLTIGVGMVAGAIVVIAVCLVCSRLVF